MKQQQFNSSDEAFEAACADRGYNPTDILPDVSKQPEWMQRYTHSSIKRLVIAEAINEGRVPKFDGKEVHYEPVWFLNEDASGFGSSITSTNVWDTDTTVGARLVFFERSNCDYFRTNFLDLHLDVMAIEKRMEVKNEEN